MRAPTRSLLKPMATLNPDHHYRTKQAKMRVMFAPAPVSVPRDFCCMTRDGRDLISEYDDVKMAARTGEGVCNTATSTRCHLAIHATRPNIDALLTPTLCEIDIILAVSVR